MIVYRVLIVDDENIVRIALQMIIDWEKYELEIAGTASNGKEALEMIENQKIDIVITDLKMPIMDGIELITELRRKSYKGEILILSNYDDFELVRQGMVQGAADYLLKFSLNPETFIEVLEKLKEKIRLQRSSLEEQEELYEDLNRYKKMETILKWKKIIKGSEQSYLGEEDKFWYDPGTSYVCWVVFIEDEEAQLQDMTEKEQNTLFHGMSNTIKELFEKKDNLSVFGIEELVIAAIYQAKDEDKIDIVPKTKEIQNLLKLYMNLNTDVMCSDWFSEPRDMKEIYKKMVKTSGEQDYYGQYRKEIADALQYIDKNVDKKFAVSDVAEYVNMSESYLCTMFKEKIGMSIIAYVNKKKMELAARLIEDSNMLLKEVAFYVGITDPYYFNRLFKKYYGVSPSRYKERNKGE